MNRWVGLVAVLLGLLSGCAGLRTDVPSPVEIPKRVELNSGDASSLNYTLWYIHTFSISGPKGSRIGGGGGNMLPIAEDGRPGRSGGRCCMSYPSEWQSDLRVTVRWLVDKKQDGKTRGSWYKAENVRIEPYTRPTAGVWAIFLPGDRVKIVVGNPNARELSYGAGPPAANDPYVVQGATDEEWNYKYPDGKVRGLR
nr:DUF3304 domain-containing protein [Burkholderia diffusa]